MKNNKYNLLFKTGDAEIRALEKSDIRSKNLFPIIEITRGRKSKTDQIGLISKRIKKIEAIFENRDICIDLTTDKELSNPEIDNMYSYSNGYEEWIYFLTKLKQQQTFSSISPTILVDTSDPDLENNLLSQVKSLYKEFDNIVYRNNLSDDGYIDDINTISQYINSNDKHKFTFILDCEYVPVGAINNTIEVLNARINKIRDIIPGTKFIVVSTSFPRYVSDIGNDDYDIFPVDEIRIHDGLNDSNIEYGDYGSINPVRNDTITMARGWIPRIDIPTPDGIYYYRLRKKGYGDDYSATYSAVAKKVISDNKFPSDYNDNWGIKQVIMCSNGDSPGASPGFWISVRMSVFIDMQLKRLHN